MYDLQGYICTLKLKRKIPHIDICLTHKQHTHKKRYFKQK